MRFDDALRLSWCVCSGGGLRSNRDMGQRRAETQMGYRASVCMSNRGGSGHNFFDSRAPSARATKGWRFANTHYERAATKPPRANKISSNYSTTLHQKRMC